MTADESNADPGVSMARRALIRSAAGLLAGTAAASSVLAEEPKPPGAAAAAPLVTTSEEGFEIIDIPHYSDELMSVINLHEFEGVAKKRISTQAYDYIRAGAADELTLQANLAAYGDYWIRRRVMVDVSHVDTSLELFGHKLDHPVILGPVGLRRLLNPDGDRLTILAAHKTGAILVGPRLDLIKELAKTDQVPMWWAASLGHATAQDAQAWARESEAQGASALCISLDYPYTGARDQPSRDHWESQWSETPRYNTGEGEVTFQAGMVWPYFPNLNWEWFKWVRGSTKLPIVAKGITTAEDARMAVKAGVDAIAVSNHGGRTLDGAVPTLHALPEVVDAVSGKVPVIVDGGVRRGGDVIKCMSLGAKAVMIGRPYLWGLAAYGQEGVQRVVELLTGELRTALGLSGAGNLAAIDRSLIRPAWKAYPYSSAHA
jgi:isopentenyl diphosphate isomerase/L-lactate dehydrogenase-like FMN-dependent dehydrogenase